MEWRTPRLVLATLALACGLLAAPAAAFHFPWDQGHDTFRPFDPNDPNNPPPEDRRDCRGDPVDLKSGNFFHFNTRHDVEIPGTGPTLSLAFVYHSQDGHNGPFGFGWHSSLTQIAVAATDGVDNFVIFRQNEGKRKRFTRLADGSWEPPPGVFQELTDNPDGSLTLTHRDGVVEEYDARGRLTAVRDRNGNVLTIAHDATGLISSATDADGRVMSFVKGPNGKVAQVIDPLGRVYDYDYDAAGNLVAVSDPLGNVTAYGYDARHNLTSIVDPNGNTVVTNSYDSLERVRSQTIAGGTYSFTYLGSSATEVRDPRGGISRHEYNECGNPTVTIDPLGRRKEYEYDADFNLIRYQDGNGNATLFDYDARGNLTRVTDGLGNVVAIGYEPDFSLVSSITDPRGQTTSFAYDANGNLTSIVDAAAGSRSMSYDAVGRLVSVTDQLGNTTAYSYDAAGNLASVTDSLGRTTTLANDLLGNLLSATDALGRTTSLSYDGLNRLVGAVDGNGGSTAYTYDANGNVIALTDPRGQVTSFAYDARNRLTGITDPLGNATAATYDAHDNLTSVTNRRGQTVTFAYDAGDQLIQKTLPGGVVTSYSYDAAGNRVAISDPDSSLSFTYDALNRIVATSTAGSPFQPAVDLSFTYESNGLLASRVDPVETTTYAYDALNRVSSIALGSGASLAATYDPLGRRLSLTRPNGITSSRSFDAAGQLTAVAHQGAAVVASLGFTHDAVGNSATVTQQRGNIAVSGSLAYTYDALDRLTDATHPLPATPAELFRYDAAGNRIGVRGTTTDFVYDAANRLLEDDGFLYDYDADGNLTSKTDKGTAAVTNYAFDAENRLTRIDFPDGSAASYRYDGLGRRIEKNVAGQIVRYVYDQEHILLEYAGAANALMARYTYSHAIDEPLIMQRDVDGSGLFEADELFYYHEDQLGSILDLTDAAGSTVQSYVYDAFGRVVDQSGTLANPFTYAARELDAESGLYFNRARYYDPASGRFLSEDPVGPHGGMNPYAYAFNNPVNGIDPFGWDCQTPGGNPGANAAGGAATGFGGGLGYASNYQNNPTSGGQARLGTRNPASRYGWDRSFHLDTSPRGQTHFNADIGPLRRFNHRPIPPWATRFGSTAALRTMARGAIGVGLALDAYDIVTASPCDRGRAIGGAAGGWGGALAGAAIGSAIAPGVGTVIGGVVGGLGGSAVGQWLGSFF